MSPLIKAATLALQTPVHDPGEGLDAILKSWEQFVHTLLLWVLPPLALIIAAAFVLRLLVARLPDPGDAAAAAVPIPEQTSPLQADAPDPTPEPPAADETPAAAPERRHDPDRFDALEFIPNEREV